MKPAVIHQIKLYSFNKSKVLLYLSKIYIYPNCDNPFATNKPLIINISMKKMCHLKKSS